MRGGSGLGGEWGWEGDPCVASELLRLGLPARGVPTSAREVVAHASAHRFPFSSRPPHPPPPAPLQDGWTPLHSASRSGRAPVVAALHADLRVEINARDNVR